MSDAAQRLALEMATMTPEQLYVLQGLVAACHAGLITSHIHDWERRLGALTAHLRAEYASKH